MVHSTAEGGRAATRLDWIVACIGVVAVAAGTLARIKGLGAGPLAADEYYLLRSADNVARTGWPEFACGGYYVRALLLQYPIALLRLLGVAPEVAVRVPAVLAGLVSLPAAWWLGMRLQGRHVAWLAIAWLALSVWEVEMSRFGRMYAPFQAIALWYCVFFIRHVVDREPRAYGAMLLLSIASLLTWEGGLALLVANALPFVWLDRRALASRATLLQMLGAALLLLFGLWTRRSDFRAGELERFPVDIVPGSWSPDLLTDFAPGLAEAGLTIGGRASLVIVAAFALVACLRLPWRARPMTSLGFAAAVVAALLHQLVAVAVLLLFTVLAFRIPPDDLAPRRQPWLWASLAASAGVWIILGLNRIRDSAAAGDSLTRYQTLLRELASFPDILEISARPLLSAVPVLSLVLASALAIGTLRLIIRPKPRDQVQRVVTLLLIVMLVAISLADPPRHATRYSFFLYPFAVLLAITAIERLLEGRVRSTAGRATLLAVIVAALFMVTEDWQPAHLARIDAPETIAREGLRGRFADHLVERPDLRSVGRWVDEQAAEPGTLVVSGIAGLEYYANRIDLVYVSESDPRHGPWACRGATADRWTGLPLVDSPEELREHMAAARKTLLVLYRRPCEQVAGMPGLHRFAGGAGGRSLCLLESRPHHPPDPSPRGVPRSEVMLYPASGGRAQPPSCATFMSNCMEVTDDTQY
jgi:hypothetical protein